MSVIHVWPERGAHFTDGTPCPCNPEELQNCPECLSLDPDHGKAVPAGWRMLWAREGCFRCGGAGLVEKWTDEMTVLLVHREG